MTRFTVPEIDGPSFRERATAALAALAARPGYVRGRLARAVDDPAAWVLTTEWDGVGSYRRALGAYDVKVEATPLLALAHDEPSAFELVVADEGAASGGPAVVRISDRAAGADQADVGDALPR